MIYIVDGTGEFADSDYQVAMAGSHCNMIYYLNRSSATYWRGPDMLDLVKRTSGIAANVYQELMRNEFPPALLAPGMRQSPKTPIVLVGYSRGAAAVVMVAKMLEEQDIPVAAMFLFDAVDRTISLSHVDKVPGNVQQCYHAVRNEGAEVVMEHEERQLWTRCEQAPGYKEIATEFGRVGSGSFTDFLTMRAPLLAARFPLLSSAVKAWSAKSAALKGMRVAMRNSFSVGSGELSVPFGNCARSFDPKCRYEEQPFAGTHAALGGLFWTTFGAEVEKLDREAGRRVWTWMSSRMHQCGVRVGKAM
jgi:hypothetical protein